MAPHNDSFPFKSSPFRFEPPGAWRTNDSSTALVYSNRSGARVSIPFFGSAVYLYSSLKADRYLLRILIDGVTLADVNLNGPSMAEPGPEIVVWNSPVLPGNHTFEAYNLGADPGRPYVALATLTVTSGEEQNHAPLVSSQPLPSNLGPVNNQSGLLPRVLAAFLSLVFFSTILVLFIRHKRKQNYDKMSRMMQDRQARHRPKKLSISHSLSPLRAAVLAPTQDKGYTSNTPGR